MVAIANRDQCVSLVLLPNLLEFLGRRFGGYVAMKDDHFGGSVSLICQVY